MNSMCDLIDLESPDRKSLLNSRLPTPLIPAPTNITNNDHNNLIKDPISLITGKRDSLENNPFDMVLHKTTEYIQKRDDPFEVALEKALRPKRKKDDQLRTHSFDFTDDYNVKHSNNKQKLKVNKTLDEALIYEKLTEKAATINKISNESVIPSLTNINGFHDNLEPNAVICSINVEDADLSILNQSMMNVSLFEASDELNKNEMALTLLNDKATNQVEKDKLSIEQSASPNYFLKVHRSLSQGGNEPFKKSHNSRHTSLAEPLQINSEGGSNISSLNSLDFLNEGFLKSYYSGSSMFSNLSNISCIPKINSVSSSSTLSILSSNDTINRAFLKSETSEKLENSKLSEDTDPNNKIKLVTNKSTTCTVPESTVQFDKLKEKVLEFPENIKQQSNEKSYMDNKLIDIDFFTPEINSSKNNYKSSTSDTSTDSVFYEGDKVNKSIFSEAKLLAKTFEDLALKTSSISSTDDLITNNPLWTSELLPAFDDEGMVDNLIELPSSPHTNDTELANRKEKEFTSKNIDTEKDAEIAVNKITENIKELEIELIESAQTEKRITAATLLLDLKNLIETENNLEANKLVENLEKVLGINCENNTELLTTCLNTTNNLAKSPQKSDNSSKVIQNIEKSNMEQSQEDNLTNDSDNIKESLDYKNINLNDSDINKCTDSQKCLNGISNESLKTNIEETKKERNEKVLNIENVRNEDSMEDGNKRLLHEKVVVELLANIAKLLTSQTEEYPTSKVLKNLGKVLNFASNDDNIHERTKNDGGKIPSKSVNRRSLDADSKKQSLHKNVVRRSISVSSTKDTIPLTCSNKSACQLKDVAKRFPSDSCLINPISNKKVITKINKDDLQKDTETGAFTTLELRKEKTATISTVKNKLKKKKTDVEVTNKRGPMRAVLPVGIMQKKETINNKTVSSSGTVTPPKSHKIISSTPNSMHDESAVKKCTRSTKPVASSTPDAQNFKSQKAQVQVTKKRNFSCDISPVPIRANVSDNNKMNSSPKRKLPSPKKTTPKRRSIGSGIPKSQTPPPSKRLNSSFDINQYNKLYESPQRSSYKTSNSQKSSPISVKKNGSMQQSPLRDSNKLMYKAKPVNLISKLQRHSVGNNMAEKENYI